MQVECRDNQPYCKFMSETIAQLLGRYIEVDMVGKCGFERNERWYDDVPETCLKMTTTNFCGTSVLNRP